MTFLEDMKDFYVDSLKRTDPRVEKWPLMESPLPVLSICFLYLLLVYLGPKLVKNLQPLNLKITLVVYNFIVVGLSVYMFVELLVVSILSNYSYLCQTVDYTDHPLAMRMANVCWWFFFSKVIELLDTVFFIVRKKFNQMSFLHVYHHCTMIMLYWAGVKYVAGGQCFFVPLLNTFVHIFVYSYYGLAVFGPSMQKYLWWKKYLTKLQLIQFVAFLLHSGYNVVADCDFPKGFSITAFFYAISMIVLFANFYYQSYIKHQRKQKPN